MSNVFYCLTHWDREAHICVDNLAINGPDNDLSPGQRQTIIHTYIFIQENAFWKCRPFCLSSMRYDLDQRDSPW